jgi:hypothetical protein
MRFEPLGASDLYGSNLLTTMKMEDLDREKRRKEFEHATWERANKQKYGGDWPVLYDAGPLWFCLLDWSRGTWRNRWFDKAVKIKPNAQALPAIL